MSVAISMQCHLTERCRRHLAMRFNAKCSKYACKLWICQLIITLNQVGKTWAPVGGIMLIFVRKGGGFTKICY